MKDPRPEKHDHSKGRDREEASPLPDEVPAENEAEEAVWVADDDTIIGKALRWSLAAFAGVALAAGVVYWMTTSSPETTEPQVTPLSAPETQPQASVEPPETPFTNITEDAGIDFVHNNGAVGDKLLPETMGGGVAFFDYNRSGLADLLFINGTFWPEQIEEGREPTPLALYRNEGDGSFTNVTSGSGLDVSLYGMGVAVGDYNNDGYPDVFVTGVGPNRLFKNLGNGEFEEVTEAAGIAGDPERWSTSATWVDYNNDSRLDLFVCNYVQWSRDIDFEVDYTLVGIGRAYGPPMNFQGTFPSLYRNEGDGTFTDVSEEAGVQIRNPATGAPMAKALGVALTDFNADGWPDLVVANDTVRNFVFLNRKDGTFEEVGTMAGIAFDSYGNARGAMGIDIAQFRNDGSRAVAIGNFANEMTALFVSQGDPLLFTDEAITRGIGPPTRERLTFGIFFFDYDLDGGLDLLQVNGHLEEEINKVQESQHYRQSAQLFWNAAGTSEGSRFIAVPPDKAGEALFEPMVGRGSAYADIDRDGDLDGVITQIDGPPLLLRNDQDLGHNWIRVRLIGRESNRDGIGARIELTADGQKQVRHVTPTRGYLSQSENTATFGLGRHGKIDSLEVFWPGGKRQVVSDFQMNQVNVIEEGADQGSGTE